MADGYDFNIDVLEPHGKVTEEVVTVMIPDYDQAKKLAVEVIEEQYADKQHSYKVIGADVIYLGARGIKYA